MRGFSPRLECTKLLHCGNPERGLTMPGLAEYLESSKTQGHTEALNAFRQLLRHKKPREVVGL